MQLEICFAQNKEEMRRSLTKFSRDEEAAKDAVQEAFCKALAHRSMLEQMPDQAMRAWLFATARNALIDSKRKSARLTTYDTDIMDDGHWDNDPADRIIVRQLLHQLPNNLREIIVLRYFAGLNSTEIGAILKLSPATVRTRLRSALTAMRQIMLNKKG